MSDDKSKTRRFSESLKVPQALWIGAVLFLLTSSGGFISVWAKLENTSTKVQERMKAIGEKVDENRERTDSIQKSITAHGSAKGHSALIDRVSRIEKTFDDYKKEEIIERSEFRNDMKNAMKEVKDEIKALRSELRK